MGLSKVRRTVCFHDARVAGIELHPGGALTIKFGHIEVYIPRDDGAFSVFSHEASLSLQGVSSLEMHGAIPADGWVVDLLLSCGTALDNVGDFEFDGTNDHAVFDGGGRVRIAFNGGSSLVVDIDRGCFSLDGEGEFQELFVE